MAAAAYVDHFAAECLVSMSSRAVVHGPREGPEPGPEGAAAAVAATLPRVEERRDGKDSASLFVVARILADLNQQAPAPAPAERREGAAARKARTPCRLPPAPPPAPEPACPGGEGAAAATSNHAENPAEAGGRREQSQRRLTRVAAPVPRRRLFVGAPPIRPAGARPTRGGSSAWGRFLQKGAPCSLPAVCASLFPALLSPAGCRMRAGGTSTGTGGLSGPGTS
ncbi:Krueppel-like factor 13 [Herpailurus yagouaroundi]|uniref:Krueppel-like factor 13 n=1 Tax=Herpailurus yagouaroundi TaxID=1608482 RepID=UPI001AD7884A|nr:Krueppel-like factor 13 [Puma yagouaroundi]